RESAAMFAWRRQDLERAWALAEQAVATHRVAGDTDGEAWSLRLLATIAGLRGHLDEAQSLSEEATTIFRRSGELKGLAIISHAPGLWAMERGDYARARALLEESLARCQEFGTDEYAGYAYLDLGVLALHERRYQDSVPLFVEGLESALRHGRRVNVAEALRG